MRVVLAKNYIDNLREEAMKGWAEKLAQGWMPGPPPPGYMTVVKEGKRVHDFDPQTYKSMQRIFQLMLEPHQTVETIRKKMYEFGITSKKGRMISKSRAHLIMKNPFYVGVIVWNGKEYPGKQPRLITQELFDAVQAKMSRKRPAQYKKHNPILRGIMVCEHCERNITWQLQKGHLYGSCQRKLPECKAQSFVREDTVLGMVEKKLDNLISPSPQVVRWLVTLLRQDFQLSVDNFKEAQQAIEQRIIAIKKMDDMLYDDKLAGFINAERFESKHKSFISEINTLREQKGGISQKYEDKYMEGLSRIELSQNAKKLFSSEETSNDDKRIILTKLFEKISLKDNSISVNYSKLTQAIAKKSGQTREILGYAN